MFAKKCFFDYIQIIKNSLTNMKKTSKKTNNFNSKNKDIKVITSNINDLMHQCFTKIKVSNTSSNNEYYLSFIEKYKIDNFQFKLHRFYGFNLAALILGPIYYMYSGLYLGLFFVMMLTVILSQAIYLFSPVFSYFFPMFLLGNFIGAFLANYFVILKSESNFKISLKYTSNIENIILYTEKLNTKGKFLNLFISIPYLFMLFYLIIYITHPEYFINPIDSLDIISTEIINYKPVVK